MKTRPSNLKTTDFRGKNGVQPDGRIAPAADRAAKAYWRKKRAQPRRRR